MLFNKINLLVYFAFLTGCLTAQKNLVFVGKEIEVPKECEFVSPFEFSCDQFEMSWIYMEKANIEFALFEIIKNLEQTPDYKYNAVRVLIDSVPASGFVTSFTADHVKHFQLYAAGTVRGQTVLIQAMDKVPFWRYREYNTVFDQLITILRDGDRPKAIIDESLNKTEEEK